MDRFTINYSKPFIIQLETLGNQHDIINSNIDTKHQYQPYNIKHLQLYNPIYKQFFNMRTHNHQRIGLNHPYYIYDLHNVSDRNKTNQIPANIFIKFSPLLDPYRYMIGKYDITDDKIRTLPKLESDTSTVHPKLLLYHNASYIDNLFCYLNSMLLHHHKCSNGLLYYGSYLGIQSKFKIDISDDIEYLSESVFFNKNIGKYFQIERDVCNTSDSRGNKPILSFDDTNCDLICENLPKDFISNTNLSNSLIEEVYTQNVSSDNDTSSSGEDDNDSCVEGSSEEDTDESSSYESSSDESSDDESSSDESSDDESSSDCSSDESICAYIDDFPIQMICMEKCDGTLDELFVSDEIDVNIGASVLFQIIMTLLIYQKAFKFTHNDLHTNNVMYSNTNQEFLYYKYNGQVYKVPTYGKIFKIIDFGRSIYKFNGKVFCSDSFDKTGDASAQYNCEPFFNKNKPRLEPNFSFDLCRLGSSIFDFITDIDQPKDTFDEFQRTIHRWCQDDYGKNILYKKNGDERYHNFKLYKMIARTVNKHTPEMQLSDPYFKQFETDVQDNNVDMVCIDSLPEYHKVEEKME